MFVETAALHLCKGEIPKVYQKYLAWVKRNNPGHPPCISPDQITLINIDHIYWLAVDAGYGKYPTACVL